MTDGNALERGRTGYDRQAWTEAYSQLSAAANEAPLDAGDLERLAVVSYLVGRDRESVDVWTRAHQERLRTGDAAGAARCAFWMAMFLFIRGDMARASGWFARAGRLLEEAHLDCVEQGYLLVLVAVEAFEGGDPAAAYASWGQVAKVGARFDDLDLITLARVGKGESLIALGEASEGVALLDEAMAGVGAGGVSPIVTGIAYCSVITVCWEIFDVRRAQEWTEALHGWCVSQPDLVPFRGQCLVHRVEILQLRGEWAEATEEARRAAQLLSDPPGQPAVGDAFYRQADLHRLRGEFGVAVERYRQADEWGRSPYPGLALLRLAQGEIDSANTSVSRVLEESTTTVSRAKLLPAFIEIRLAIGDVAAARLAVAELTAIASEFDAPLLSALAEQCDGAVLLAEGDARAACAALHGALALWRRLDAPYDAARVRLLTAVACQDLGDRDAVALETDAARHAFERLRAMPDLARLTALLGPTDAPREGELSPREVEVLRLIAAGHSNRAIAGELVISEKTVARHVSNIFTKLGLSSRSAATAYAYEHNLVGPPTT